MSTQDKERDRDNVFHERTSILREQGYRGFTVTKVRKEWDGVEVVAQSNSGQQVSATGATNEEAYKNVIDKIDLTLE